MFLAFDFDFFALVFGREDMLKWLKVDEGFALVFALKRREEKRCKKKIYQAPAFIPDRITATRDTL